jgi:hypothetical protein
VVSKTIFVLASIGMTGALCFFGLVQERTRPDYSLRASPGAMKMVCSTTGFVLDFARPQSLEFTAETTPDGTDLVGKEIACHFNAQSVLTKIERRVGADRQGPARTPLTKGEVMLLAHETMKRVHLLSFGRLEKLLPETDWDSGLEKVTVTYQSMAYGYPADALGPVSVRVDRRTGVIDSIDASAIDRCDPPNVRISQPRAEAIASRLWSRSPSSTRAHPVRTAGLTYVLPTGKDLTAYGNAVEARGRARLCWIVSYHAPYGTAIYAIYEIDAESGELIQGL